MNQLAKYFILGVLFTFAMGFFSPFGAIEGGNAQTPQKNFILQNDETGSTRTYIARDYIRLQYPFHYKAQAGNTFHGKIDKNLIFPADYSSSLFTDATFDRSIITTLPVGKIPGAAGVTPTGGATYTIPIYTPPGTAGMAPSISINYNSQAGNGLLGMGWNLSGISSITRVNKTIYNDGETNAIHFDATDPLALDGNRMIAITGTTYRTEVETFQLITANGSAGTGPESFEVKTKEGLTMEYGNTPDSRLKRDPANGSEVIVWYIKKIKDHYGNYVIFNYANDADGFRIQEINYTGSTTQLPYNSIKFYYDKRTDANTVYIGGEAIKNNIIMREIDVLCEDQIVTKYHFNYAFNIASYLTEVSETGADGKQLNNTRFQYGDQTNPHEEIQTSSYLRYVTVPVDFDGDGQKELFIPGAIGGSWRVLKNFYGDFYEIGSGTAPFSFTQTIHYDYTLYMGVPLRKMHADYTGDGKEDVVLISNVNGNPHMISVYLGIPSFSNGNSGFLSFPSLSQPFATNLVVGFFNSYIPGDFNGDGATDLFILSSDNKEGFFLDFKNNMQNTISNISEFIYSLYPDDPNKIIPIDFDGDGKMELLSIWGECLSGCIAKVFQYDPQSISFVEIFSFNPGFIKIYIPNTGSLFEFIAYPGDFNGDGKTDIIGATLNGVKIFYFTGKGVVSENAPGFFNGFIMDARPLGIGDFNGDGKSDISGLSYTGKIYYSTGNNAFSEQIVQTNFGDDKILIEDFTGDGKADILSFDPSITTNLAVLNTFNNDSKERLLHNILDGYNFKTSFSYERLNTTTVTPSVYSLFSNFAPTFPFQVFNGPLYVTQSLSVPDGIGGTTATSYVYQNATLHIQGKGFLGFSKITGTNTNTGISTVMDYEYILNTSDIIAIAPSKTQMFTTGSTTPLAETTFTNNIIDYGSKRYFSYASPVVINDNLRDKTITTNYTYNNDGNPTEIITNYGTVEAETLTTTTWTKNGWWIENRPVSQQVTRKRLPETDYIVNTTYDYYTEGKLKQSVNFSGLTNAITTDYSYYNNGNLKTTSVSAVNVTTRETTLDYDLKSRFVTKTTNPLNQIAEVQYDPKWGKPLMQKGVDGLVTTYEYDGFGRLAKATTPDGLKTTYQQQWDIDASIHSLFFDKATPEGAPSVKTWYDIYGRSVKTQTDGFNSQPIFTKQTYNNKGQLETKTLPFYSSNSPVTTTYSYNTSGLYTGMIQSEFNPAGINYYAYSASGGNYTVSVTNQTLQTFVQTTDAAGKVIEATDGGGTLDYTYFSNGQVKDIKLESETLSTMTYDDRGSQKTLWDANAGTTTYDYNAFGELTTQEDANGNIYHNITYDKLGRITSKEEGTGNFYTWTYVTSGNGLNQVQTITSPNGITQQFFYDHIGRLSSMTETIDGVPYTTSTSYNNFGYPDEITYPSGFKVKREYDNKGYLLSLRNKTTNAIIWEGQAMNALGQYSKYLQGNGCHNEKTFDSFGRATLILAGTSSPYYDNIQNLQFDWNLITGNLNSRYNVQKNITEYFDYDNLNRLEFAQVDVQGQPTAETVSYESNGNIQTKTGVGTYIYSTIHPNAVELFQCEPTTQTIQQNITNNAFNKTETVTEGDFKLEITYGPDQQRKMTILKYQNAPKCTTIFEGNYEKIIYNGGNTYEVHYIAGGSGLTAINVRTNGGVDQMYYVYTDHLGSILTLTDTTGTIIYETNFDAWGRERNPATWDYTSNPNTPPEWLIRGFTGHEHLNTFALINMNGRVYDPLLGRFNSPDNFVQDPYFSQSFNRYSYVMNNPLIYTDPTGNDFQEFDDQPRDWPKWWETILDFFGYSLGHYTGYISSQDGGTDAFDSNPPGYSELSSDYEISAFYSTDDQGAQGGGSVFYKEGSYSYSDSYLRYLPAEGIGLAGSFNVKGNAKVYRQGGNYYAQVYASGKTPASMRGAVQFGGDVEVYSGGKLLSTHTLSRTPGPSITQSGWQSVGSARILLPNYGNDVYLRFNVGYSYSEGAGWVSPIGGMGNYNMNIPQIVIDAWTY